VHLEMGVVQRQCGIGRYATRRVIRAHPQDMQPDRRVDGGAQLEVLRGSTCAQRHQGDHEQPHAQAGAVQRWERGDTAGGTQAVTARGVCQGQQQNTLPPRPDK
jgi:hypothetical protein